MEEENIKDYEVDIKKSKKFTDEILHLKIEDFIEEYITFASKCEKAGIVGEAMFKLFAIYSNNKDLS